MRFPIASVLSLLRPTSRLLVRPTSRLLAVAGVALGIALVAGSSPFGLGTTPARAGEPPPPPAAGRPPSGAAVVVSGDEPGDLAARISAALVAAPKHGVVWVYASGQVHISRSIKIEKPVQLIFSGQDFVLDDDVSVSVLASSVHIEGMARSHFSLGARSSFRFGTAATPVYDWALLNVLVAPSKGRTPQAAVVLSNAREGRIEDVFLTGFSGPDSDALRIEDNCWSNRLMRVFISNSTVGIHLVGDQINALGIHGSMVNLNRTGLLVQGGTMAGLLIGTGTQIERNDVGIKIESGTILGLTLSDVYAECFSGAPLVVARGGGRLPVVVRQLSIIGGQIYAKDPEPILLDATARDGDDLRASIVGTSFTTSSNSENVARVRGRGATMSIMASTVSVPKVGSRNAAAQASSGATVSHSPADLPPAGQRVRPVSWSSSPKIPVIPAGAAVEVPADGQGAVDVMSCEVSPASSIDLAVMWACRTNEGRSYLRITNLGRNPVLLPILAWRVTGWQGY